MVREKISDIVYRIIGWIFLLFFGLLCFFILLRIFVYDTFPVNSRSMYPTIQPGDRILANKLIFGPRIYTSFDFGPGVPMESIRLKGFRSIRHNDIVLFNFSRRGGPRNTVFAINEVFIKRCVGLPGDTISIVNGIYRNSALKDSVGLRHAQEVMSKKELLSKEIATPYYIDFNTGMRWTTMDFGPLYIPRKGDVLEINKGNMMAYFSCIFYETSLPIVLKKDGLYLDDEPLSDYCFQQNYYFMAGDNVEDSFDSRHFGLIPEDLIISVAPTILHSHDPHTGKMNWSRFLKPFK